VSTEDDAGKGEKRSTSGWYGREWRKPKAKKKKASAEGTTTSSELAKHGSEGVITEKRDRGRLSGKEENAQEIQLLEGTT